MSKGRKPLPTAIKQLRGTVQPCRTNPNELKVAPFEKLPLPPRWFSKIQKKIYKTKGEQLKAAGVLSPYDLEMFISFCREYGNYIETASELEKIPVKAVLNEKSDAVYKRMAKINRESWDRAKSLAAEFGFTPSSRAKFSKNEPESPEEEDFS